MEPSPPGWYRDPHSPGGRRYWDGQTWVDVDAVLEARAEPGPVATTGPRLISQRRAEPEPAAVPPDPAEAAEIGESTDDVDTESRPD
jgi:hypothetical protein